MLTMYILSASARIRIPNALRCHACASSPRLCTRKPSFLCAAGRRFESAAKVPIKSTSSFHHHSLHSQPAFRDAYTLTWVRSTLSQRSGECSLCRSLLDKR